MCILCTEEMKNKLTLNESVKAGLELLHYSDLTEEEKRHIRQKLFEYQQELEDKVLLSLENRDLLQKLYEIKGYYFEVKGQGDFHD